jgi:error-prone DNA polymerase
VRGLPQDEAERLALARRGHGAFATVEAVRRASGISVHALRCLSRADAFGSLGLDRRAALWMVKALRDDPAPLFESARAPHAADDAHDRLPGIPPAGQVVRDYDAVGLSLRAHPMSFVRAVLDGRGVRPCADLRDPALCPHGARACVAGVVLVRQRPSTASGVVFITLEDETGIANLVLWSSTFDKFRRPARLSTALLAQGRVEREGEVTHLHVTHLESLDDDMPGLSALSRDFH